MNRNGIECKNGFEIDNERLLAIKSQILFKNSHCLSLIKTKKEKIGFQFRKKFRRILSSFNNRELNTGMMFGIIYINWF